MVGSRTATAAVGIVGSLLASAALWWYFDTLAFFLFVPFVPFLFSRSGGEAPERRPKTCPECGFQTEHRAYEYCPRDGTRLEEPRR